MKKLALGLTVGLALATSGCTVQTTPADCVNVIVDFQSLKNEKKSQCISVESELDAMTVFNAAGYGIIGTDKYGLQIVCRVNGLPTATQIIGDHKDYRETCAEMPAEFAYWALLVRTAEKDWHFAEVGIADLKVKPGEQVALVFSVDEKIALPN
jgi:hypothetical protein